jgi:hypothetical protein
MLDVKLFIQLVQDRIQCRFICQSSFQQIHRPNTCVRPDQPIETSVKYFHLSSDDFRLWPGTSLSLEISLLYTKLSRGSTKFLDFVHRPVF